MTRMCRPTLLVRACIFVFNSDADTEDLEHTSCSPAKDDDSEHDDDENSGAESVGVVSGNSSSQSNTNSSSQAGPEQHHLVRVRKFLGPLAPSVIHPVDEFRQGEDGRVSRRHDSDLQSDSANTAYSWTHS
jgi:hypothetical protein